MSTAPLELLDSEGEGIYLLASSESEDAYYNPLFRAAWIFFGDTREWKNVEHRTVYMRPKKDSDEWERAEIGRFPRGWRRYLPRRWRPVAFVYLTPNP